MPFVQKKPPSAAISRHQPRASTPGTQKIVQIQWHPISIFWWVVLSFIIRRDFFSAVEILRVRALTWCVGPLCHLSVIFFGRFHQFLRISVLCFSDHMDGSCNFFFLRFPFETWPCKNTSKLFVHAYGIDSK